jgi:hypothetical protein
MLSNRLAVVIVGGACMLAAGAGAYVATRQNAAPPVSASLTETPAIEPAVTPVHETEAVMEPAPSKSLTEPVPARAAVPVVERETARPASPPRTSARETPRPRPAKPATPVQGRNAESAVAGRPAPPAVPSAPDAETDRADIAQAPSPPIEPVRPVSPPRPTYEELTIPSDSVIGLEIENTVSTESAEIEDRVEARVTRDVLAEGRVAIPAGARALGNVTLVERGGKVKERARLAVRFHTLVLADGTNIPIQSDTLYRDGESPARSSAAKIGGGAVGGAIVGAIFGGAKGAVIGGSAGAAGGTAATMAGKRRAATLPAGSTVTVRVLSPVGVTVER